MEVNKIKKLIALASLLVALGSLVPVVLSDGTDITASVTVEKSCGISLDMAPITFTKSTNPPPFNLIPGDTSDTVSRDVTNTGTSSQTECTYTIKGTDWIGGPGMDVKQTKYMCTDSDDNACTATSPTQLITSEVNFLGLNAGITSAIDFNVTIPSNQASGTYTQNITITLVDTLE